MVDQGGAWPDSRFTALAGCALPIVQAPMAGAGGVELAAAAVAGGALGSLPCGMIAPEDVVRQVGELHARSSGPINLNFFCHTMPEGVDDSAWRALLARYYAEFEVSSAIRPAPLRLPFDEKMCEAVEAVRPEVVSFHFGLPSEPLLSRVKAAGAVIFGNATSVAEARWLAERGADAVIAQGWEAGGHAGTFLPSDPPPRMGLIALVPQVADAIDAPVIAAGGIGDARAIAAAFALGASAVQIGTAYLHCPESRISDAHREGLGGEKAEQTLVTNLLTGGLARGLPGRLTDELGPIRSEAPPYPLAAAALAPIRAAAEPKGEFGFGPAWAGQAAPLGKAEPALELTRRLAGEARALLRRMGQEG